MPRGLLFWRCFTHWLGAMGFLVSFVALFPLLGVGAMQLYRAEAPGLEVDRLRPRLSSTARILWTIYLTLSVALTVLLLLGGMDWFDALCQMFAAIGTGGYSTKNTSIGWWHSAYIEWVIILFLWLSSTNFALWWFVAIGRPGRWLRDAEWRFYTTVLVSSSLVIAAIVWATSSVGVNQAIRDAFFAVVSLASTTGFVTADYEKWQPATQFILFHAALHGRVRRVDGRRHEGHPGAAVRQGGRARIPPDRSSLRRDAVAPQRQAGDERHDALRLGVHGPVPRGLRLLGEHRVADRGRLRDRVIGSRHLHGRRGPGLGDVGPMDNYLWMHWLAKLVLTFDMLAGRLELITLMIVFTPAFWRR